MNANEKLVYAASLALERLQTIDRQFRDHLKTVGTTIKDLGAVTASGSEISVTCLGVDLKVLGRPVAVDGEPIAIEYLFAEEREGTLTPYWRIYLDGKGNLFKDVEFRTRLCDFNNTDIIKNILIELGIALLRSPRFAPTA